MLRTCLPMCSMGSGASSRINLLQPLKRNPNPPRIGPVTALSHPLRRRSEEHTSELQSLMRNSYAVFCLKKKTGHRHIHNRRHWHMHDRIAHHRTNSDRTTTDSQSTTTKTENT